MANEPDAPDIPTIPPPWSTPVFISGIIVGLMLTTAGFAALALGHGSPRLAQMIAATGLGIVLGAFGSTAVVRHQGLTIAGVAAITLVLFLVVTNGQGHYLRISVSNVPTAYQASLYIDQDIPGRRVKEARNQVDFMVVEQEIAGDTIKLLFHNENTEVPFDCIPATLVRPKLGSGGTMEWWFADDQQSLRISDRKVGRACEATETKVSAAKPFKWPAIVDAAQAQEALETVPVLLDDLESTDVTIRRAAREGLARWGVEAVPEMMDFWALAPENYRRSLGVSVALTEMLRDNKDSAAVVSSKLQPQDFDLLVDAIADPDRTKRIYATEFLFDLGAPGSTQAIVEAFPSAGQDGQFNSIFVLTNVASNLDAAQKQELAADLVQLKQTLVLGDQTKTELEKLLDSLS
jgi:hypothetical protein